MKRIVLIDLSGLFWANWHATSDMELSEAYNRTTTRVRDIAAQYDYAAVCCDCGPYLRKAISADYKAQRDAPPPQAVEQITRVKERLAADGLLLWEVKGYEADDLIATAVGLLSGIDTEIMIASSDKDLLQLVSDTMRVRALSFASGVVFDEKAVFEKFGVPPHMMAELLALMGDSSDNIAGIKGVGVKTAAALLAQFGSLEDIFSGSEKIEKPKLKEAIVSGKESARLALKLVTLYTNAPIKTEEIYERREPQKLKKERSLDELEDEIFTPEPTPANGTPAAAPATQSVQVIHPKPVEPQQALAIAKPEDWALQLEPASGKGAYWLAERLNDSRLFSQFTNADAIFAVILRGRSLGIDAVTSLANFHVIKGRPVMHASLIVGLVLKSGKAEHFDLVETTEDKATWITKRRGSSREVTLSWTIDEALEAGLVERQANGNLRGVSQSGQPSNWDKYRRTMLRWRAATELARAVYPDVTTGLYTPDEIGEGVYNPEVERKAE